MEKYQRLRKEAKITGETRGHIVSDFYISRSGKRTTGHAKCLIPGCDGWIRFETHPEANGIEISGSMCAENCPNDG